MALILARLLLCLCLAQAALWAQQETIQEQMQRLRIPRVTRPPKITDFLNGVPREAELVVEDFRQYTPGDGIPASLPTAAYLSYDDKNIYFVFVCKDDPRLIRARLAKHDQILTDDRVIFNIDTFHDRRHMYWFDVNPYGVQADGSITDGLEDSPSWDTVWRSEARILEDGWIVWAAVPFKSLRFPNNHEQTWGLILGRYIQRNNEVSLWPYLSRRKPGWVQQGGDLEGLQDISPGRNLQFIPYLLSSRGRFLESPPGAAARLATDTEIRGGLDAKVVVKDAFTFDVAVNPDFSQVESDEPQVTVNQRYEVYFPEKRPFFLENTGFFVTPSRLFFSRRILDPRAGVRLTGKLGNWALGTLFVDDRGPGKRVAPSDPAYGKESPIGVFRLQREFRQGGKNSSIGVLATSQDFAGTYNRVYAVDAQWQVLANWLFTGQAAGSRTRLSNGAILAGPAYRAALYHQGRHFISETSYTDISPNFLAQLGYIPRLDIREARHTTGYQWRYDQGSLQSFGPEVTGMVTYDRQGWVRDWLISPEFRIDLTRGTSFSVERDQAFELYGGQGFRRHRNELNFHTEWLSWLWLDAELDRGVAINYNPPAGKNPFLGRMMQAEAALTFRPGPRVQLEGTYIYSGLRAHKESGIAGEPLGAVIFQNHLVRAKINYMFTRRHSLRLIADYSSLLPNARLTSLEKEKRVGLDALFTYMLNPGTALHIGFTDIHENYRLDPLQNPSLFRTTAPDLNTGRQFFVKLSYLFRL